MQPSAGLWCQSLHRKDFSALTSYCVIGTVTLPSAAALKNRDHFKFNNQWCCSAAANRLKNHQSAPLRSAFQLSVSSSPCCISPNTCGSESCSESLSYLLYLPPMLIYKDINTPQHANALSWDLHWCQYTMLMRLGDCLPTACHDGSQEIISGAIYQGVLCS